MSQIFLSYRRKDSAAITGRIFDRLVGHFGRQSVIMDIDNIPYGKDFRAHVAQTLEHCDVILAVIGPQWAGLSGDGKERIDRPTDWVRIELEAGLRRKIPVVPLLVEDATMPPPERLPESLRDFAFYHAAEIDSGVDFHVHMDRLIRHVEQLLLAMGQKRDGASDPGTAPAGNAAAVPAIETQGDVPPPPEPGSAKHGLQGADVSRLSPASVGSSRPRTGTTRRRYRIFALVGGVVIVTVAALAWFLSGDSEAEISRYFEDGSFLRGGKEIRYAHNFAWSVFKIEFRNRTYCYVRYNQAGSDRYTDLALGIRNDSSHVWLHVIGKVDSGKPINIAIDGSVASLDLRNAGFSFAIDSKDAAALIETMKGGNQLEIGFSDRSGKALVEAYELLGLSGALTTATRECPDQ